MNNEEIHKLDMKSKDIVEDNISKISELFPDCINEGKIDFDMLKQELSKDIMDSGKERYQLTWTGKNEAKINANRPINKTLRPLKEKSVNFDNTKNLYIEGDNLEVLKILQESYLNKVNVIYIDPPYNTGNDFVYNDKFVNENELNESGQVDEYNNRLVTNSNSNGKYHSDWLSMIYSRIKLARNLLSDDGVIFISIDDNEMANMKKICDEIFGEDNFTAVFPRLTTKSGKTPINYMISHDYVLCYTKNKKDVFVGKLYEDSSYKYEDEFVNERGKYNLKQPLDCNSISYSASLDYPIEYEGTTYYPGGNYEKYKERKSGKFLNKDYAWRWSKELFEFGLKNGWIVFLNGRIYTKGYLNATIEKDGNGKYQIIYRKKTRKMSTIDFIDNKFSNDIAKKQLANYDLGVKFDYPKPIDLIKELLSSYYKKDILIVDFFSGSGTTADAILRLNSEDNYKRKYILIQLPEKIEDSEKYGSICDIAINRIKKVPEQLNNKIDSGFRVYKVDSSNMKDVYYAPTDLQQSQLNMFESNIKEGRTAEDLLTQVILDLGLTLDLSIEERKIINNNVYFVENNSLVACFDDIIDINIVDEICKCNPLKIVFKESSFKTDSDKINVFERIKKLSNDTEINII